jgi:hypothetical protein
MAPGRRKGDRQAPSDDRPHAERPVDGEDRDSAAASDEAPWSDQPEDDRVEEVRRRAYFRYLARGPEDGRDVEDWLSAEDELRVRDESRGSARDDS